MTTQALTALSPLDGRYQTLTKPLTPFLSEFGLMRYRLLVEIEWILTLAELDDLHDFPGLSQAAKHTLHVIAEQFSLNDAARIKEIEKTINHDVKAIEYFIKERMQTQAELKNSQELVHFGCTSEDINNLAYALMLTEAKKEILIPVLDQLIIALQALAHDSADLAMLARTHGQAATPTTLGKEMANVIARLVRQVDQLKNHTLLGKFNGASGNYNALMIAYPQIDWEKISAQFIIKLGLKQNVYTTQIEPHDSLSELFAILVRINTILIDLNRDMWSYISIAYFKQKSLPEEVGSSTMPHKINPIYFENAEGNLGLANALFEHFILKLPISRWQRDLSDSTVLRNIGVAIGYAFIAYQSTLTGLGKIEPDKENIADDLNHHWEVLAEAIQTVMRRYQLNNPYETLKTFTRGKTMNATLIKEFISSLSLPKDEKERLLALTPSSYIGYAAKLAREI